MENPVFEWDILSEWLHKKVAIARQLPNRSIKLSIIGPKFNADSKESQDKLVGTITEELLMSRTLPAFSTFTNDFTAAIQALQSSKVAEARKLLTNLGQTQFQKDYIDSICFNLDYIESRF